MKKITCILFSIFLQPFFGAFAADTYSREEIQNYFDHKYDNTRYTEYSEIIDCMYKISKQNKDHILKLITQNSSITSALCDNTLNNDYSLRTVFDDVKKDISKSVFKDAFKLCADTAYKIKFQSKRNMTQRDLFLKINTLCPNNTKKDIMLGYSLDDIKEYISVPLTIMLSDQNYEKFQQIRAEDITDYFFSKQCSDHFVKGNLDDDAPFNVAAQKTFDSGDEYFIDFPTGHKTRAFPGVIIKDTGFTNNQELILMNDLNDAKTKASKLKEHLKDTYCKDLNVYIVTIPYDTTSTDSGLEWYDIFYVPSFYAAYQFFSTKTFGDIKKAIIIDQAY